MQDTKGQKNVIKIQKMKLEHEKVQKNVIKVMICIIKIAEGTDLYVL